MERIILRFRGEGAKPAKDVERLRAAGNVRILDDSSPRMLLVEAPEDAIRALIKDMPGWIMSKERMYPLPDTRPHPEKHP